MHFCLTAIHTSISAEDWAHNNACENFNSCTKQVHYLNVWSCKKIPTKVPELKPSKPICRVMQVTSL